MANPEVDFSLQDQPTPEQLERIVTLGMTLAKENGSVRRSRRPNAHIFLPAWVDRPLGEEDYCATVHRIAGRIGKIGYRAYSLWLHEGFSFVESEPTAVIGQQTFKHGNVSLSDRENGYVNTYVFKWTTRHVLDATRHHRKFKREGRGIDAMRVGENSSVKTVLVPSPMNVVDLARRREEVSRADAAALIEQMRTYGAGQRAA